MEAISSEQIFYKTSPITFTKGVNAEGKEEKLWRFVLSSTGVDYDDERMTRKALLKAASDLLEHSTVFFNHKHDGLGVGQIVATHVEDAAEKSFLFIDVRPSAAEGVRDIVTQVNEGVLKCSSIGGKTLKKNTVFDKALNKSIGEIDDLIALEGSIVGIGANPDAMRFGKSLFMKNITQENSGDSKMAEETKIEVEVEKKVEVEKDARLTGSGAQSPTPNQPALTSEADGIEGAKKLLAEAMRRLESIGKDKGYGTPDKELETHSSGVKSLSETEIRLQKLLDKFEGMNLGAPAGLVKKEEKFGSAPEQIVSKTNQTVSTSANDVFKKQISTKY